MNQTEILLEIFKFANEVNKIDAGTYMVVIGDAVLKLWVAKYKNQNIITCDKIKIKIYNSDPINYKNITSLIKTYNQIEIKFCTGIAEKYLYIPLYVTNPFIPTSTIVYMYDIYRLQTYYKQMTIVHPKETKYIKNFNLVSKIISKLEKKKYYIS